MRKIWKTLTTTAALGLRYVVLTCSCFVSLMGGPMIAEAVDVGDKVIVVNKEGTQLRVVNDAVGKTELGRCLTVEKVNGEWLWVHMEKKGWIKSSDVVAETEAVEFFTKRIEQNHDACDYFARGKVWEDRGETDIAIADFSDAIRQIALDYASYMRELSRIDGKTSYVEGDTETAQEVSALPVYDDDSPEIEAWKKKQNLDWKVLAAQVYMRRAISWAKKHDYDNAIHDCDQVLQMAPYSEMLGYRGTLWQIKGITTGPSAISMKRFGKILITLSIA